MCAGDSGFDYMKSAVDWANFIRDLFKAYVTDTILNMKFSGIIEIDESIFGHKVKYHCGVGFRLTRTREQTDNHISCRQARRKCSCFANREIYIQMVGPRIAISTKKKDSITLQLYIKTASK